MNSPLKHLFDFVQQCLTFQERLEPYQLDQKSVEQLFAWLDKRRRGFIDVSDFYEKFPDLQEDELFYVFKTLDVSRTGNLTLNDLKDTMMSNTNFSSMENGLDFQRTFKGYLRLLKASYHALQGQKVKLGLQKETVQTCYEMISLGRPQISVEDLLRAFTQQGFPVERKIAYYLGAKIFQNGYLKAAEFVQIFTPMTSTKNETHDRPSFLRNTQEMYSEQQPNRYYSREKINSKMTKNKQVDSRIDEILKKYERVPRKTCEINKVQSQENFRTENPARLLLSQEQNKLSTLEKQNKENSSPDFARPNLQGYSQINLRNKNTNIEDRGGAFDFNRRREQLRRGSLERQKIIEEVLVRRKQTDDWDQSLQNFQPNPTLEQEYKKFQPNRVPIHEFSLNVRPQSASKLMAKAHSPTASSMNWHNSFSRPDLKLFYKNTGENLTKNGIYEKENILKRAEQEAAKKIEQIERKARLKVMEKRSANGVYSRWLK